MSEQIDQQNNTAEQPSMFQVVNEGFSTREAIEEAKRCLHCKIPQCKKGCPIENDIPDFVHELSMGNMGAAMSIINAKSNLPAICGRVCPHEKQCQGHCVLGKKGKPVQIGKLEQFIADFDTKMNLSRELLPQKTRGRVAVIGSGPAGLTVAGDLARQGFNVTIFEGTPKKQESWKFLGTLVSAATVGGVMMLLNETYGFASGSLAAPQANAMAAVIDPLMNGVGAPWVLYGIGALLAIVLTYFKIPALAFALGMFIPLELNVPLVVGGAINWWITSRSKDAQVNKERGEKGTLIASGFIAGGALMGVVSALLKFGGIEVSVADSWWTNPLSEVCSLIAYALLITYFVKATKK